jgi:hypothetical protein
VDQGGQLTDAFDHVLADAGIEVVKTPPRCPCAHAYAERRVRGLDPAPPRPPAEIIGLATQRRIRRKPVFGRRCRWCEVQFPRLLASSAVLICRR